MSSATKLVLTDFAQLHIDIIYAKEHIGSVIALRPTTLSKYIEVIRRFINAI